MIWLILGLLLWSGAHFFKRFAPGPRARLGDAGKGLVAVLSVAGIVLMVIGYRAAELAHLWYLGGWAVHLNNLLMLVSVALLGLGSSKSRLRGTLRHPMLTRRHRLGGFALDGQRRCAKPCSVWWSCRLGRGRNDGHQPRRTGTCAVHGWIA